MGRTDAKGELQYVGHLKRKADSLEKTLMLGKIEDRKRRGRQRVRWLRGVIVSVGMRLQEMVKDREALFSAALGVTKSWT